VNLLDEVCRECGGSGSPKYLRLSEQIPDEIPASLCGVCGGSGKIPHKSETKKGHDEMSLLVEEAKAVVRSGQLSYKAMVLINGLIAENEQLKEQIKELEADKPNKGLDDK